MYHGHDWISNFIKKLINSEYNHSAIYDKDGFIYESLSNRGIVRKKIEDSVYSQKTDVITIFRVKNLPIEHTEKLIETIKNYGKNKFGHSQSLLLTGILWKEKQNFNFVLKHLSNLIIFIFEKLVSKIWDSKNKNMICSELIYRAYMDTAKALNDSNFIIHIPMECNPILYASNTNDLEYSYPCEANANPNDFKENTFKTIKNQLNNTQKSSDFEIFSLIKYSNNKEKHTRNLERKTKKAAKILKQNEFYNFITPVDLVRSLDTYPVATYKTEKALKNKDCKFCTV